MNEAAAKAVLAAHGDALMRQTGAFACGVRQESGQWMLVLTVSAPPAIAPPVNVAGLLVRVEQGDALSPG